MSDDDEIYQNDDEDDEQTSNRRKKISKYAQQSKIKEKKAPRKTKIITKAFWNGKNTELFYKIFNLFGNLDSVCNYFKKYVNDDITYNDIKLKYRQENKYNKEKLNDKKLRPKFSERCNRKQCQVAEYSELNLNLEQRWSKVSELTENRSSFLNDEKLEQNLDLQIEKNLALQLNLTIQDFRQKQRNRDSEKL